MHERHLGADSGVLPQRCARVCCLNGSRWCGVRSASSEKRKAGDRRDAHSRNETTRHCCTSVVSSPRHGACPRAMLLAAWQATTVAIYIAGCLRQAQKIILRRGERRSPEADTHASTPSAVCTTVGRPSASHPSRAPLRMLSAEDGSRAARFLPRASREDSFAVARVATVTIAHQRVRRGRRREYWRLEIPRGTMRLSYHRSAPPSVPISRGPLCRTY